MAPLHPCPSCRRHVRTDATACPFCDTTVDLSALPPRRVPPRRLGRGALLAFGAAALVANTAACSAALPASDDAAVDAPHDAAFLPRPDVWYPDAGACATAASYGGAGTCDPTGQRGCQHFADLALPGWDTVSICDGRDGGSACVPEQLTRRCGDGDPCAPGWMCARPFGAPTAPYACVCPPNAGAVELGSGRCAPDGPDPFAVGYCNEWCPGWARQHAPPGTVGLATCLDWYWDNQCVRASQCPSAGGCRCGDGPPCGSGEVCVQTPDGQIGCVCAVAGP